MNNTMVDKRTVQDLTAAKTKVLVELGQEVYLAYRRGDKFTSILVEKGEFLKDLDKKIHSAIEQKEPEPGDMMECSCGAVLTEDDLFCQQCGKKADVPNIQQQKTTLCYHCDNEVPADANYCNVCGVRM
ncbi:zinc ribbon domain-containing protein [Virgibacillus litoralis]|uniref:RNA polymerase subunit RPABC4/transcription elongation factor Spt4 n=1 Tax=Virgibacillus litoralis TaxID=578221 RepID=A0ABS4HBX7_9BACI|nr:zinc ribbon domain-containing protein [Virgibacillus litoralis]MBP1948002.1 RNA polymerase subunit RPABC4/transcription elongation factor Spt4 [Virgibacillus litoralis]